MVSLHPSTEVTEIILYYYIQRFSNRRLCCSPMLGVLGPDGGRQKAIVTVQYNDLYNAWPKVPIKIYSARERPLVFL